MIIHQHHHHRRLDLVLNHFALTSNHDEERSIIAHELCTSSVDTMSAIMDHATQQVVRVVVVVVVLIDHFYHPETLSLYCW